jgi:antitoxin (DNA-binding transcriptional repressor) of toxin-antitoxin stability system
VKDGRPVALLSGPEGLLPNRVPGTDMGALTIHDDFDAPLPEFEQ